MRKQIKIILGHNIMEELKRVMGQTVAGWDGKG